MKRIIRIIAAVVIPAVLMLSAFHTALGEAGAGTAQAAYEVFYSALRERNGGSVPDHFGGAWIDEGGRLHVNFKDIPEAELAYYKDLLAPYGGLVEFGTARFSENELRAAMDSIVSELLRSGVSYTSCDVDAQSNSIRIALPADRLSTAAQIIPQLDCFEKEPDLPVLLFTESLPASGSEGGSAVVPMPGAKKGGFPILAVLFGAAGVAIFFLRRRAQRKRFMSMGY